jgi:hypothetical protein
MADVRTKKSPGRRPRQAALSLDATNLRIFLIGLATVGVGYFLLSRGPYNSFSSLTLAPIVLLVGYLVLIPYAILRRGKRSSQGEN